MVYRQDNRKSRHRGRYTVLGIILGISFAFGALYVYDNYKQPILDNVNQIKNTAISEVSKSNLIEKSNDQQPAQIKQDVVTHEQISPSTIANTLHILINLQRVNNGLPALAWDDTLAQTALAHSNDMIKNNYFSHVDLQGNDPFKRIQVIPNCNTPSENIAWTQDYSLDQVANKMMDFWLNSPEHRANILRNTVSSEGIGVAINGNYVVSTDDFC